MKMTRRMTRIMLGSLGIAAAGMCHQASAIPLTAVTSDGQLIQFDSATPGTIFNSQPVTGLASGERLLGIDRRPADGQIYGLGSGNRVYVLNSGSGSFTQVGADGAFGLTGANFGFDFNPVPDRIRVVSDSDQNLRLNPNNGTLTATDGTLAYAVTDANTGRNPTVVHAAYTNVDTNPATGTTLFVIDFNLDILVVQNPPNNGTLNTQGALGIDIGELGGFDIFTDVLGNNFAFAALSDPSGGPSSLYSINIDLLSPNLGRATQIGLIGSGVTVTALTANSVPLPGTVWLMGSAAAGYFGFRRRYA